MATQVTCRCGWRVVSDDLAVVADAARNHDAACPFLFEPDRSV